MPMAYKIVPQSLSGGLYLSLSLLYPICFMSLESRGLSLDHLLFSDSSMLAQLADEMVEMGMDG